MVSETGGRGLGTQIRMGFLPYILRIPVSGVLEGWLMVDPIVQGRQPNLVRR